MDNYTHKTEVFGSSPEWPTIFVLVAILPTIPEGDYDTHFSC